MNGTNGPWFHPFGIHTAGEFVSGCSVAISSSTYRHFAGVCVTSRNVAKDSSTSHGWSMRLGTPCGEKLPSPQSVPLEWWFGDANPSAQ
ncbi:hypothetical protein [Desulfosporosinus sp. BG]|uniref:hypothetical protein n=1 Tax=Desulfosporosinus sp. BG TaxID=1633135 RepID=UPI00114C9C6A|nr:hypothetical protein [Desulfosporosinus sp. BG]